MKFQRTTTGRHIVYNSLTHATMAGFRGAAESQQIIFHAEGLSIHLRISKVKAERIILGQLLQRSSDEFLSETTVSLVSGAERSGQQQRIPRRVPFQRSTGRSPDDRSGNSIETPSDRKLQGHRRLATITGFV